jgi:hypothetical protein
MKQSTPSEKQIVEIALRVLVAWTSGMEPASEDVGVVQNARPSMAQRPVDEIACQIIHDLSSVVFREAEIAPIQEMVVVDAA